MHDLRAAIERVNIYDRPNQRDPHRGIKIQSQRRYKEQDQSHCGIEERYAVPCTQGFLQFFRGKLRGAQNARLFCREKGFWVLCPRCSPHDISIPKEEAAAFRTLRSIDCRAHRIFMICATFVIRSDFTPASNFRNPTVPVCKLSPFRDVRSSAPHTRARKALMKNSSPSPRSWAAQDFPNESAEVGVCKFGPVCLRLIHDQVEVRLKDPTCQVWQFRKCQTEYT